MSVESKIGMKSEIVAPKGRAYHLGLAPEELATNVFFVGDPARATRVASYFDLVQHEVSNREYLTYTGLYKGIPVSVVGTGIGTDNIEIAFVEAYILNEFDLSSKTKKPGSSPMNFIRLGTSGGVQPDIQTGTLVVAEYGLGFDSTGFYYESEVPDATAGGIEAEALRLVEDTIEPESRFRGYIKPYVSKASTAVIEALVGAAKSRGVRYETGITVSTPGFYGPSSRFIDGLKNTVPSIKLRLAELEVAGYRVINMEMESSLLFHLASAVGYRAGTICPVISNPLESDALIDYDETIGKTIEIGLKAMIDLCGNELNGEQL